MPQNNDFKVGDRIVFRKTSFGVVVEPKVLIDAGHLGSVNSKTRVCVRLDTSVLYCAKSNDIKYADDVAHPVFYGQWQVLVKVKNCYCSDGVRRVVRVTGPADTFFSYPAQVRANGKTVTGFVAKRERPDGKEDYQFIANSNGKNASVLSSEVADVNAK